MFVFRNLTVVFFIFIIIFITNAQTLSAQPYSIQTVYFIPNDSEDKSAWLDLGDIMKNIQSVYQNEMDRHGFPSKTFRLETDNKGDVIVHKFKGKHNKAHYGGGTIGIVIDELRDSGFSNERTIYAIVMAGMNALQSNTALGVASARPGGWFIEGKDHGYALSAETTKEQVERIMMHELGHTFGLWHIALYDPSDQIMGSGKKLSLHESRWLSKHHYFNDVFNFSFAPSISNFHKTEVLDNNHIRFRIDASDPEGLHQIYVAKNTNILGWDYIKGVNDSSNFDIGRWFVSDVEEPIWVQLMDNNGNWVWYQKYYKLPIQEELEDGKKYLTIRNKDDINSLTPLNNENEWCGWANAGIFEKIPHAAAPNLPDWYLDFPNMNDWTHWFYSHAKSRFVYDVSNQEYNRFESHFYMPNPCNGVASVKVICFADGKQIYQSEVLRAPAAQNKHFQINFPKNTKRFTIEITDAWDDITCDHFVFGEAMIKIVPEEDHENNNVNQDQNEEQIEPPDEIVCEGCEIDGNHEQRSVDPKRKLTTQWAKIKSVDR